MARDTRTGSVLESMVRPALDRGGYKYAGPLHIGSRVGGGKHLVDLVVTSQNGERLLVSMKWQQTSGTAEQKVPFEVICLMEAVSASSGEFARAYLVLGGGGWKLRPFYVSGSLKKYVAYEGLVQILSLEDFVAKANKAGL
jgi:hypothetical protein